MKTSIRSMVLGVLLTSVLALSATSSDAACTYQSISYGQTVNGSLSTTDCADDFNGYLYYADYYQFTGTAGDKIYIQQSSSSIDPWLMLIFPSGDYIIDNNGGGGTTARIPVTSGYYTLPTGGIYILDASSNAPTSTGNYTLQLVKEGSTSSTPSLTVMEFHHTTLNHYFMTADTGEAVGIDNGAAGPGWSRTGYTFKAYPSTSAPTGSAAVCRFYGTPGKGPNSHFYTADSGECAGVKADPGWFYEGIAYYSLLPSASGCATGTVPLYRNYNNRWMHNDSNHRFTTDYNAYQQMIAKGWAAEGIVMCVGAGSTGTTPGGSATEQEIRLMVNNSLSIVTGAGTAGITALFGDIFSALSDPASTCPQVTSNPPLTNLDALPPSITISANYAAGCTASNGSSMSGSATLALSNLTLSQASSSAPISVSGNFSLTLNNVTQNGVTLGNGQISGNASLVISLGSSSSQSSGTVNMQLTNLVLSTGDSVNGTIAITIVSNTQQNVGLNLTTNSGPIVLNLQITESATSDVITINTTSTGTVGNYSTQISNLQLNPAVCENYPVGGTISFTKNSQTSTVTFNGSCDGNYNYTGP
ncbi:MAG: hypothetical protein Q8O37_04130 [Sulfuricellaceae bacterium]|nr:hypothetical protein [Sulfuricellaceae bacterium]